jgi:hypothetical protein
MPPNEQQITAAIAALRADAETWHAASDELRAAADGYEEDEDDAVHRLRGIY